MRKHRTLLTSFRRPATTESHGSVFRRSVHAHSNDLSTVSLRTRLWHKLPRFRLLHGQVLFGRCVRMFELLPFGQARQSPTTLFLRDM